jgi:hypothetical protein
MDVARDLPGRVSGQRGVAVRVNYSSKYERTDEVIGVSRSSRPVRARGRYHRLVSLVLGLNSHVYSLRVAVTLRSSRGRHGVKKESRVFNEEFRVHVVRAVIGVGVHDHLRIRHVLLHDERIHRGHDHVVTAVDDECWLLDRLQIVVGSLLLDAPIAHLSVGSGSGAPHRSRQLFDSKSWNGNGGGPLFP